jgi:succinoglycan biosynthesis protein ExoA
MTTRPLVSIVLPIRNEASFIERTLAALASQTYPRSDLEIIVADGMSEDATASSVHAFAARHEDMKVEVLINPRRIMPAGFNRGFEASHGDVIVVLGGHCVLAFDYVERCVEILERTGADCVGGVIETVGETVEGWAIAAAQSSPFGVGAARFRMVDVQPGYVDTVAFGAYRRSVFERIGTYDEELVRNQDDEFNFRLTQAGGRIWLDPSIRATYYSRSSLRKLARQYYEYGLYKVRVIQKRGAVPAWRHLVPAGMVLVVTASLTLFSLTQRLAFLLPICVYGIASLAFSVVAAMTATNTGNRRPPREILPWMPPAFAILHFSYGLGFLAGLWRWRHHGFPPLRVARQACNPTVFHSSSFRSAERNGTKT